MGRSLVLATCAFACSYAPPPTDNACYVTSTAITVTTLNNEVLLGGAQITATQGPDGTESISIGVCARTSSRDFFELGEFETSTPDDAGVVAPLPLTQSDSISFPTGDAWVQGALVAGNVYAKPIGGSLTAAHGNLHAVVTWGDAGATATIDGAYAFTCETNHPDPDFKTTFCKQFVGLVP